MFTRSIRFYHVESRIKCWRCLYIFHFIYTGKNPCCRRMTIREEETTTTTTNVDINNFFLNNVSLDIKKKLKIYYITVNRKIGHSSNKLFCDSVDRQI